MRGWYTTPQGNALRASPAGTLHTLFTFMFMTSPGFRLPGELWIVCSVGMLQDWYSMASLIHLWLLHGGMHH